MAIRMNFISRYLAEIYAEVTINRLKRDNPAKLADIRKYQDCPDYPWKDPEENAVFWRLYREMVREPQPSK